MKSFLKTMLIAMSFSHYLLPTFSKVTDHCFQFSIDETCISCEDGFILSNSSTCIEYCDNGFYFNSSYECTSLCSLTQIGSNSSKQCEETNPCPSSASFGQSFHSENINSLLISNEGKIVTTSNYDTKILIWDSLTGELLSKFEGHSSPPLKLLFSTSIFSIGKYKYLSEVLYSFSINEIIYWDFLYAEILSSNKISGGQLTTKSEIDSKRNYITTFGTQGEFFLVNYISLTNIKYIGHSHIVETVLFLGENNLISYARDQLIILWDIDDQNKHETLLQYATSKMVILQLKIMNQEGYLFIAFGGEQDKQILTSFFNLNLDQSVAELFKMPLQTFDDHISPIIDFIVDPPNSQFITYSSSEILVYSSVKEQGMIKFQLMEKVNLTLILPLADLAITSCAIIKSEKFIITTLNQIYFFAYSSSSSVTLSSSSYENYITIYRKFSHQFQYQFAYSSLNNDVYIFSPQLIAVNYSSLQIHFIITNFITPSTVINSQKVFGIDYSESEQIIATISQDNQLIIYDFITEERLNIIKNPINTDSFTQSQILAIQVLITLDQSVCVSYDNNSLICYDLISSEVIFKYESGFETFTFLKQDYERNFLIAAGANTLIVFDFFSQQIVSQLFIDNQFQIINFKAQFSYLIVSSPFGIYLRLSYPSLDVQIKQDYEYLNPTQQNIIELNLDEYGNLAIAYYDQGLILIFSTDLTLIKQINSSQIPSLCYLKEQSQAFCIFTSGLLQFFSLYSDYSYDSLFTNFPILGEKFSSKQNKGFSLMNQGTYGTRIKVSNGNSMLTEYIFDTSKEVFDFLVEDSRLRLFAIMNYGDVSDYHFTQAPGSLKQWKQNDNDDQQISKVILYQEGYKIIIISRTITIFNYVNSSIDKIGSFHNRAASGLIIDTIRSLIISFSSDSYNNLFVWNFEKDIIIELVGHFKQVNGISFLSMQNGYLLSYSEDGQIIIWDYINAQIKEKLNLNQGYEVLQMFYIPPSKSNNTQLIISLYNNRVVVIYNYSTGKITSRITLSEIHCRIILDTSFSRILFYYQNSIQVYSYKTGLKTNEMLGFDGKIGSNILIRDNYLIAYGQRKIISFSRDTLNLLFSQQLTQNIIQIAVIDFYVGIISDSVNNYVYLWNYKTGILHQGMTNFYYSAAVNGILADEEAKVFLVRNVDNYIFQFNPSSTSFSKITNFMIMPTFSANPIKEIAVDYQSNLLFAYNENSIMQWSYFSYLGIQGQERSLPSNFQILTAYHLKKGKFDIIDFMNKIKIIKYKIFCY